jgi:integrase
MRTKLLKRTIEATPIPAQGETDLRDTETKGFACRIRSTGERVFVVRYRTLAGTRRTQTIGRFGALTVEQARAEAKKILGKVAQGEDPFAEKQATRSEPTLAHVAERFLEEHVRPKLKPSTARCYEEHLRAKIFPKLGRKKISAITRADVSKLHHDLRKTPGAANRVLATFSKLMSMAEKWDLRPGGSNPCKGIERYRERKLERFLSSDELARLGAALAEYESRGDGYERIRRMRREAAAAVRLLLFTGCRRGEILDLRWEHVDFERGVLRLPDSKTGAKPVVLGAPALAVLESLGPKREGWVFEGGKNGRPLRELRGCFDWACGRAEIEGLRIHDLRHTFASVGAGGGLGLPVIGALLGHRSASTTARYSHLANDPLKEAANRIGSTIAAQLDQRPDAEVIPLRGGAS